MSVRPRPSALILAALLAFAAIGWIQGLRAAADRQGLLEPGPAAVLPVGRPAPVRLPAGMRFAVIETPGGGRIALYRWLPGRPVLRWLEPAADRPRPAVAIPLRGLESGEYAVCEADSGLRAGPSEMDRPARELRVLARFLR